MQAPQQIPARVLYNYAAQDEKQLPLVAGRVIFIQQDGGPGGWSRGADPTTGRSGFFPSDYVRKEVAAQMPMAPMPLPQPVVAASTTTAIALYDFPGNKPSEQPLRKGETVIIISRGAKGGWSKGERGIFPTDYVRFTDTPAPTMMTPAVAAHVSTQPFLHATSKPQNTHTEDDGDFGDFQSVPTSQKPAGSVAPVAQAPVTLPTPALQDPAAQNPFLQAPVVVQTPVVQTPMQPMMKQQSAASLIDSAFSFDEVVPQKDSRASFSGAMPTHPFEATTPAAPVTSTKPPADDDMIGFDLLSVAPSTGPSPRSSFVVEAKPTVTMAQQQSVSEMSLLDAFGSTLAVSKPSAPEPVSSNSSSLLDFDIFTAPAVSSSKSSSADLLQSTSVGNTQSNDEPSKKVFVGSLHSRLGSRGGDGGNFKSRDRPTFSLNEDEDEQKAGIWTQPFFHDLFTSVIIKRVEKSFDIPPLTRLSNAFHSVRLAISQVKTLARRDDEISEVLSMVSSAFKEASDVCKEVPIDSNDAQKFADFLAMFMSRIKHLRHGEITISPCVWSTLSSVVVTQGEDGAVSKKVVYQYHGVIILVYRTSEGTDEDFSLTVVNASKENGGLDYHAVEIDNADGSVMYNLAFELVNIPNQRIQNTAFW